MSEDDIIFWQEILDRIVAGRTSDLTCPFCKKAQVKVTQQYQVTRLECPTCGKYIEGHMQE